MINNPCYDACDDENTTIVKVMEETVIGEPLTYSKLYLKNYFIANGGLILTWILHLQHELR